MSTRLNFSTVLIVFVVIELTIALVGPWFTTDTAKTQDLLVGVQGSSASHPLGTDDLGRDVLAQLIAGGRSPVIGAFMIALGAMIIGSSIGLISAFAGGWFGAMLMRIIDGIYALPSILVAIVLAGVTDGGYLMAVALMAVLFSPFDARLVRSATLVQLEQPYMDAARLLGTPKRKILTHQLWPNVRSVELANACVNFAYALVTLSALSFLGIGVPVDATDWGLMLSSSIDYLDANPWAAFAPGLAIVAIATSVALLGDVVQERLSKRGHSA